MKNFPKTAVVSGASSGIGRELADLLEQNGCTVYRLSRTNPTGAKNFIPCDLTDCASVESAAKSIGERTETIDLLINNAGQGISGATELLPPDQVRRVFDVNYFGAWELTRALLPRMRRGGKIVTVSSACALFALPFRSVYCSAKAALSMMSYSQRMELSESGICVVTVCPGDIRSDFTKNRLKYNDTNIRYGDRPVAAAQKVDCRESKRMDLKKSSRKIFNIVVKKKGALYVVGAKYRFLYAASRLLPVGLFLKLTDWLFGAKKAYRKR